MQTVQQLHNTITNVQPIPEQTHIPSWDEMARDNQKEPTGDWNIWLLLAGRGFGKTRTGAETIHKWATENRARMIALVGQTDGDVERLMICGPSGIQSIAQPHTFPHYYKSHKKLIWPNGAYALVMSDAAYERLRGPQFDAAWVDELAKFKNLKHTWDQLSFCLRLGEKPRMIITTTPRPLPLIKTLMNRDDVFVTQGTTLENAAHLSASFIQNMMDNYADTRLGQQEVYGQWLDETGTQLWTTQSFQHVDAQHIPAKFRIVVVAVDPAVSADEDSDETGIIVVALDYDQRRWVLDDVSCKAPPLVWADVVVRTYHKYKAHAVVVESNNGGDVIMNLLHSRDARLIIKPLRAQHSKLSRAEPIAALYEQKRILHVAHKLSILEQQMCAFPHMDQSPDRVDALVWGLTHLYFAEKPRGKVMIWG